MCVWNDSWITKCYTHNLYIRFIVRLYDKSLPKASNFHPESRLPPGIYRYSTFQILSTNSGRWKGSYLVCNMDSVPVSFLLTYPLHFFLQVVTLSYISTGGGWKTLKVPTVSIKRGILSSALQNGNRIFTAKKTQSSIILCHWHLEAFRLQE